MAQPIELPRWADTVTGDATRYSDPTSGKKDVGWQDDEKPAGPHLNWLFNVIYQWLLYLSGTQTIHIAGCDGFKDTAANGDLTPSAVDYYSSGQAAISDSGTPHAHKYALRIPDGKIITGARVSVTQGSASAGGMQLQLVVYNADGSIASNDTQNSAASAAQQTLSLSSLSRSVTGTGKSATVLINSSGSMARTINWLEVDLANA